MDLVKSTTCIVNRIYARIYATVGRSGSKWDAGISGAHSL
jgi:hypothetical protein